MHVWSSTVTLFELAAAYPSVPASATTEAKPSSSTDQDIAPRNGARLKFFEGSRVHPPCGSKPRFCEALSSAETQKAVADCEAGGLR